MTSLQLLLIVAALGIPAGCAYRGTRVFEVVAGYKGWVVVKHGIGTCPPLPVEHGQVIHRVPATGLLCTSDAKEQGWGHDLYYEVGADRSELPTSGGVTMRRILNEGDGEASGEGGGYLYDVFFVGTWAEYEADKLGAERFLRGAS